MGQVTESELHFFCCYASLVISYALVHSLPSFPPLYIALGPLMDSDTDSSEDEAEISSPEVKALQASSGSKVKVAGI